MVDMSQSGDEGSPFNRQSDVNWLPAAFRRIQTNSLIWGGILSGLHYETLKTLRVTCNALHDDVLLAEEFAGRTTTFNVRIDGKTYDKRDFSTFDLEVFDWEPIDLELPGPEMDVKQCAYGTTFSAKTRNTLYRFMGNFKGLLGPKIVKFSARGCSKSGLVLLRRLLLAAPKKVEKLYLNLPSPYDLKIVGGEDWTGYEGMRKLSLTFTLQNFIPYDPTCRKLSRNILPKLDVLELPYLMIRSEAIMLDILSQLKLRNPKHPILLKSLVPQNFTDQQLNKEIFEVCQLIPFYIHVSDESMEKYSHADTTLALFHSRLLTDDIVAKAKIYFEQI